MVFASLSTGALVVFLLIGVALVLFITEVIPTDVTAIGVIVGLVVLEPWTTISGRQAIAGFSNPATVTIVAMYMLSAGVQKTGLVQRLGIYLARITKGNETKVLAATVGTTGPIAGFVNNTPVVAVFIPMITDLADESGISPSKLLLPLSYAAILGGTLTLVGTSTNILASDLAAQQLDRGPIGMFEFSGLAAVILLVGLAYLMTVGRWLTPERIPPNTDMTELFGVSDQLTQVVVPEDSPLVGRPVTDVDGSIDWPPTESERDRSATNVTELTDGGTDRTPPEDLRTVDVLHVRRDDETLLGATTDRLIAAGDVLTLSAPRAAVDRLVDRYGLRTLRRPVTTEAFDEADPTDTLATAVIPPESAFVGSTPDEARLRERHATTVLGVRRDGQVIETDPDAVVLEPGDTLLVQTTEDALGYLAESGDIVLTQDSEYGVLDPDAEGTLAPLSPKTPIAVGVLAGVITVAALGWLPIVIAALAGVFIMIATDCLSPAEAYDAVSWNIIFLLAGVIPLGLAMQETGGAEFIAGLLVVSAEFLPLIAVLGLLYVLTGLLANAITPVATVVLMIPVGVDLATAIGANGFAFLLAVMFASATSFMTPVGYQTNLMVYGPGGYRFTDFLRVGGPLQFLLAVVSTVGIALIWGLT